jgi:8-oxo-dGTP pyrophosphatase MutT (NUDIX family)
MGVAFLPLHYYYNPGHKNHGKLCIILGKERAGAYSGFFNFIGGAAKGHRSTDPMDVLKEEVAEELGLVLDDMLFQASFIDQHHDSKTSFFGVSISGISQRKWQKMMEKRFKTFGNGLSWQYQEMDTICHFPVDELRGSNEISSYVRQYIGLIERMSRKFPHAQSVHYSNFVKKSGAVLNGMPMLDA